MLKCHNKYKAPAKTKTKRMILIKVFTINLKIKKPKTKPITITSKLWVDAISLKKSIIYFCLGVAHK